MVGKLGKLGGIPHPGPLLRFLDWYPLWNGRRKPNPSCSAWVGMAQKFRVSSWTQRKLPKHDTRTLFNLTLNLVSQFPPSSLPEFILLPLILVEFELSNSWYAKPTPLESPNKARADVAGFPDRKRIEPGLPSGLHLHTANFPGVLKLISKFPLRAPIWSPSHCYAGKIHNGNINPQLTAMENSYADLGYGASFASQFLPNSFPRFRF